MSSQARPDRAMFLWHLRVHTRNTQHATSNLPVSARAGCAFFWLVAAGLLRALSLGMRRNYTVLNSAAQWYTLLHGTARHARGVSVWLLGATLCVVTDALI
jgi:hypothetical protein